MNPGRCHTPGQQAAYNLTLDGTPDRPLSVTVPSGLVVTQSSHGCLAGAETALYGNFAAWFRAETISNNLLPAIQPKVRPGHTAERAGSSWWRARWAGVCAGFCLCTNARRSCAYGSRGSQKLRLMMASSSAR